MKRVGLIGCGRIGVEAHAPSYAIADVELVAVCDLIPERAHALAAQYGCEVEATAEELAARPDVDWIDVATRPTDRLKLLRSLVSFRKPIMSQKPLTTDLDEGWDFVEHVESLGVPVAVNHNARWAPMHRPVFAAIADGTLGYIHSISHTNRFNENISTWFTSLEEYLFLDHGLHYLDLIRTIARATPTHVAAIAHRIPDQLPAGPIEYATIFKFDDPTAPLAVSHFSNCVPAPHGFRYNLTVDGTKASATASFTEVEVVRQDGSDPQTFAICDDWVPFGFAGAVRSFIQCVERGTALPHSARDHLGSIALASAALTSAQSGGDWVRVDARTDVLRGPAADAYLL